MPWRELKSKVILSTGCRALLAILRHRGSRRGRTTDDLRNDNHCARARCTSASDSENCVPAGGRTAGWRGGGGTTSAQPRLGKLLFLSLHKHAVVTLFKATSANCEIFLSSELWTTYSFQSLHLPLWNYIAEIFLQSYDLRTGSIFTAGNKKGHFWRAVCVSYSSELMIRWGKAS